MLSSRYNSTFTSHKEENYNINLESHHQQPSKPAKSQSNQGDQFKPHPLRSSNLENVPYCQGSILNIIGTPQNQQFNLHPYCSTVNDNSHTYQPHKSQIVFQTHPPKQMETSFRNLYHITKSKDSTNKINLSRTLERAENTNILNSAEVFQSSDFNNTNNNNILSEIWGIPVPVQNPKNDRIPLASDQKKPHPPKTHSNAIPMITPSIHASYPLNDIKANLQSFQGPPPGFSTLPTFTPNISQAPALMDSISTYQNISSYNTGPTLNTPPPPLLENHNSSEIQVISNIILPLNEIKKNMDCNAILNMLVSEEPGLKLSPMTKTCFQSQHLIISLDSSYKAFSPEQKGKTKSVLYSWIQNYSPGKKDSSNYLTKLVCFRRNLISKLSVSIVVEVDLSLEQKKLLLDLGVSFLNDLSFITCVKIQKYDSNLLSNKLLLLGDAEGVDLIQWKLFKNLKNTVKAVNFILNKPVHNTVIYIPRCFHSSMIGIAGARLQATLKSVGNGSVRVSFPRLMTSPSWEVNISSSGYNMCKDSVERVRLALVSSLKSMVIMGIRQRCSCKVSDFKPQEFENTIIFSSLPSGPGTPDAPGLLYSHLSDSNIPNEKLISDQNFYNVHSCDFQRLVQQTGAKIRILQNIDIINSVRLGIEDPPKKLLIEIAGLPKSHLLQIELILSWINAARI